MSSIQKIKFIDLFAGLGGLRLGFEQALSDQGLVGTSVFSSEIKPYAAKAYLENFGDKVQGDITKIDADDIPEFCFLLAGFPCQAFSNAGLRMGFDDVRGTLFFDVARIIKAKKPLGFILENVEGLVTHDKGNTFKTITRTLEELGYVISYAVLDGKDFGLAQSRRRIYICGNRLGQTMDLYAFDKINAQLKCCIEKDVRPIDTHFTQKLFSYFRLEDLIGKQIKDKRGGDSNIHSWDFALKGEITTSQKELLKALLKQRRNKKWAELYSIDWMDGMPLTLDMIRTFFDNDNLKLMLDDLVIKKYLVLEHPKKRVGFKRIYDTSLAKGYNIVAGKLSFEFNRILDPDDVVPTLVATDVSKLAVPVCGGIRSLTIREGLRLFGFPETYSLSNLEEKQAFDLLGNTVCVPVVRFISNILLENTIRSKYYDAEFSRRVI